MAEGVKLSNNQKAWLSAILIALGLLLFSRFIDEPEITVPIIAMFVVGFLFYSYWRHPY